MDEKRIERIVRNIFYKQILKELDEEKREGFHVSSLVYDCLRRSYYEQVIEDREVTGMDEESVLTFWIGQKLHEIVMSEMHEYEVEWNGIKGRIDEVLRVDDVYIVLDKKTVRELPRQVYEHHKKQVEYYSALLWKTKGINAKYGAILYIDVNNKKSRVFVWELPYLKEKILEELMWKVDKVKVAMERGKPPEQYLSWLCDYCGWWERCQRDGI